MKKSIPTTHGASEARIYNAVCTTLSNNRTSCALILLLLISFVTNILEDQKKKYRITMFCGSILVDVLLLVLTERRHVFKASMYVHWRIILFKKKL